MQIVGQGRPSGPGGLFDLGGPGGSGELGGPVGPGGEGGPGDLHGLNRLVEVRRVI